jgi:hypothetical protein
MQQNKDFVPILLKIYIVFHCYFVPLVPFRFVENTDVQKSYCLTQYLPNYAKMRNYSKLMIKLNEKKSYRYLYTVVSYENETKLFRWVFGFILNIIIIKTRGKHNSGGFAFVWQSFASLKIILFV